MSVEWVLSIVVQIFKMKGDIRNCSFYEAVKIHEHGMKAVERVFEKRLCRIVFVDEMQFGFMADRGTFDAVFIVRGCKKIIMLEEKICVCVLWT